MKPIIDYLKDNNFPNKLTRDQAVLLSYAHIDKTGLQKTFIAPKRQVVIKNWFKKTYNITFTYSELYVGEGTFVFEIISPVNYTEDFKILMGFKREGVTIGRATSISLIYEWCQNILELKGMILYFILNFDSLKMSRSYSIDKDWNIILAEE